MRSIFIGILLCLGIFIVAGVLLSFMSFDVNETKITTTLAFKDLSPSPSAPTTSLPVSQ